MKEGCANIKKPMASETPVKKRQNQYIDQPTGFVRPQVQNINILFQKQEGNIL